MSVQQLNSTLNHIGRYELLAVVTMLLVRKYQRVGTRAGLISQVNTLLKSFPYYENYVDLTRLELSAIHAAQPTPPGSIAFIGSGPLPLSSICLARSEGKPRVLNIDHNADAIDRSKELWKNLGATAENIHFNCVGADDSTISLEDYDVVYLAALVGNTQEQKEYLLRNVVRRMRKGSLVVVRSAHGLRRLLYPVSLIEFSRYKIKPS